MKPALGNDLIDRAAAHNLGRARQPRFLSRVLTEAEQAQLAAEADGDLGFARLWSAKEAAYKAAKKVQPGLVFAPRRWQVEVAWLGDPAEAIEGAVAIDAETRAQVRWWLTGTWLHCIALIGPNPSRLDWRVCRSSDQDLSADHASARERQGFSRSESAGVRALARGLLAEHGMVDIEILREAEGNTRQPPRIHQRGVWRDDLDLSLSHDGAWLAAAIIIGTAGPNDTH